MAVRRRRCAATPGTGCDAIPAYVVTVLAAYLLYHFRTAGPNPGHTWEGLFRNLTLTQIYTDNYLYSFLHQGLTQMWSLAVEVAFYIVLPLLAYLLLVVLCRRRWRPPILLAGLGGLALLTPAWLILVHTTDFLPDAARLWAADVPPGNVSGKVSLVIGVAGNARLKLGCSIPSVAHTERRCLVWPGRLVGPKDASPTLDHPHMSLQPSLRIILLSASFSPAILAEPRGHAVQFLIHGVRTVATAALRCVCPRGNRAAVSDVRSWGISGHP